MKCLYLDQFAVSNICNLSDNELWVNIYNLIVDGVKKKKLICPGSIEHLVETSGADKHRAVLQDNLLKELSYGWHFYHESDITAHYIMCKIRKIKVTKCHFIRKEVTRSYNEENVYGDLQGIKQTYSEMVEDAADGVNKIRKITRDGMRGNKQSRDSLISIIKNKNKKHLLDRFSILVKNGSYKPDPIKLAGYSIPFWADALCSILVSKHRMTRKEAKIAYELLDNEGVEIVPPISIRASLEAMLANKNANESPNDHIDIMRIAAGLPFSDIMMIDGSKASDVKELKLDKEFKTSVYSGKEKNIPLFIEHLEQIIYS